VRDRYLKAEGGKGGKRRGRGESLAIHVQSMRAWWGGSATPGVVRGSGFAGQIPAATRENGQRLNAALNLGAG
jgi:hypothetical protein